MWTQARRTSHEGECALQAKKYQRSPTNLQKREERQGTDVPSQPSEVPALRTPVSDSSLQDCKTIVFCCWSPAPPPLCDGSPRKHIPSLSSKAEWRCEKVHVRWTLVLPHMPNSNLWVFYSPQNGDKQVNQHQRGRTEGKLFWMDCILAWFSSNLC